jgi:hypothetical protein
MEIFIGHNNHNYEDFTNYSLLDRVPLLKNRGRENEKAFLARERP